MEAASSLMAAWKTHNVASTVGTGLPSFKRGYIAPYLSMEECQHYKVRKICWTEYTGANILGKYNLPQL